MSLLDTLFKRNNKVENRSVEQTRLQVNYVGQKKSFTEIKNEEQALKNSVVYRALSILSDSVASIPLNIYHKGMNGFWYIDEKNSLDYILTVRPNNRQNIYEFLEQLIIQLFCFGDTYIYIRRNENYDPAELILCYPHTVYYNAIQDTYKITDTYNKINGLFDPSNIIHIKNKCLKEFIGEPIFTYAGRSIGIAKSADEEAGRTISNGGKLKGLITSESSLTGFGSAIDSQVDTIRDNLTAEIESGKDILTLQSGADFKPFSMTVRDLQLVEWKNITLMDLARFFGISPSKLGIVQGSNYKASEEEELNFFIDTLDPLLKKIEKAFTDKLISTTVYKKYKVEFDRTSLPYYKLILNNYEKMLELGLASVNDIRKKINKIPVRGGDQIFISTNTQLLDNPKVIVENKEEQTEQEKSDTDKNVNK